MKKILTILFAVVALSVTAFAESVETPARFVSDYYFEQTWSGATNSSSVDVNVNLPIQNGFNQRIGYFDLARDPTLWNDIKFGLASYTIEAPDEGGFYGDIGVNLAFYVTLDDWTSVAQEAVTWITDGNAYLPIWVYDSTGRQIVYDWIRPEYYTVDPNLTGFPGKTTSPAIFIKYNFRVDEATPMLKLRIGSYGYNLIGYYFDPNFVPDIPNPENPNPPGIYDGVISYRIASASLFANVTSAELEELRGITEAILEQNELTQQYYSQVMEKVDDLYQEVGNLADLQQEAIEQFDNWNIVTDVPSSVTDKTDKAEDVLDEIESLEKPEPEEIVPDLEVDTEDIGEVIAPFFQNALIIQVVTMTLSFAFISYVLFGKKG